MLRIKISDGAQDKLEVLLTFAYAPREPIAGSVSANVGEITITNRGKTGRKTARLTAEVSLGAQQECTAETIRRAAGAVADWIGKHHIRRAGVTLPESEGLNADDSVIAVCEGLALGSFTFDRHQSPQRPSPAPVVHLLKPTDPAQTRRLVRESNALSEAVNLAREWGHEPPNVLNPVSLATRVRKMARAASLRCTVYDQKKLAAMKAGAILAVGSGSKTPSRLIVLEYPGAGRAKPPRPIVLVGKAITFDTGGYSLKDKNNIVGMKYDKCGGMAVIGVMKAAAALKLRTPLVGIVAAAENMISGRAYRPNDIIKTMSGKTVEIISTDAEGRLVLADALTFAQQRYKPKTIIDLATLTGGVVVSLGSVRAGLFANDDKLAEQLLSAGDRVYERLWRLPLDEEYGESIKGDDSDLKNSAGRAGHAPIAANFLMQFIQKNIAWAHLDIAGTADCEKALPYCPKGATGFGVRLLIEYLRNL